MKYIRHIVKIGNWPIGHERLESDIVADTLVEELKAVYIDKLSEPKVMDKKFHTLEDVVAQAAKVEQDANAAALAQKVGGTTATSVKKKG